MMGNLFQRATNHNQRVNKKQTIEIYSPASSGGKWKYEKYVSFPWSPLEATLSILNMFFVTKTFLEGINKTKRDCNQCRIISFIKMSVLKRSVLYFSRSCYRKQTVVLTVKPKTSDTEIWASQDKEQFEPEAKENLTVCCECLPHFCSFLQET